MGQVFTLSGMGGISCSDSVLSADKYTIAVIKARDVVTTNSVFVADKKRADVQDRLYQKLDHLLGYLLSQFKASASDAEVREVLSNRDLDILNEKSIATLPDGLVPVAIIRTLLGKHRVLLNPTKLKNWKSFHDRYERQVVAA